MAAPDDGVLTLVDSWISSLFGTKPAERHDVTNVPNQHDKKQAKPRGATLFAAPSRGDDSAADTASERPPPQRRQHIRNTRLGAHHKGVPLALRPSEHHGHTPTARLGASSRQSLPDAAKQATGACNDMAVSDMTRVAYATALNQHDKAMQASAARTEREERRRFAEEQKDKLRQRARQLRGEQLASNRPMEAVSRAASRRDGGSASRRTGSSGGSGGPVVVSLGTMSSMERSMIQKELQRSPRLRGEI